jgi:hypothetical protein
LWLAKPCLGACRQGTFERMHTDTCLSHPNPCAIIITSHITTQTPRKGTARRSCNQRVAKGREPQERRDSRDAEQQQTQNRTRHKPPARANPNRTTPLHYLIRRPRQAGAKSTAQSISQEPITIPLHVEVAPAHSYTQLPHNRPRSQTCLLLQQTPESAAS